MQGYQLLGFVVIVVLYAAIGFTSAVGFLVLSRKFFSSQGQQGFFGLFLIAIAAFYLGFVAYFEAAAAWRVEAAAVAGFAVLGVLGTRLPFALSAGYVLHGVWDILHELQAHGASFGVAPGQLTEIPLAYGVFCIAFDLFIAAYFLARRAEWFDVWNLASTSK